MRSRGQLLDTADGCVTSGGRPTRHDYSVYQGNAEGEIVENGNEERMRMGSGRVIGCLDAK